MTEMLERVARAIERSTCDSDAEFEQSWGHDNVRHNRLIEARAAIEAMRVPTDTMRWAGGTALHDKHEDAEGVWRAMVSAELGSRVA